MDLLQIYIFERFVAANTQKKYQGPLKAFEATFLDGFFFRFMQIRSLSSELKVPKESRCAGGGPPSPNFSAYSQLDEMPHVYKVTITQSILERFEC